MLATMACPGDGTAWDADAAWSRLAPRLKDVQTEPGVIDIPSRTQRRARWIGPARFGLVAAAAVLLIAVAVRMTGVEGTPTGGAIALTSTEMRTGVGEQRTIDLTDGSQVVLGAASTLRLAMGFGESNREVFLEGQAFLGRRHRGGLRADRMARPTRSRGARRAGHGA